MLDHGIFRDIFETQQLRAQILSNSWQEAKPVQRAMTGSYGPREKNIQLFNSSFHSVYLVFSICLFSIPCYDTSWHIAR